MALLYVFVICLCSQSLFEDRFCHLRCREAGNLMWKFSRKRHEDYSNIKPFSFNPNHLDRPSGEWETKANNPLKRVLKNDFFFRRVM